MALKKRSCGLLLRKGIWHIEGEASFAFWNAVKGWIVTCFPGRRKSVPGARGQNFLFCTPRKTSKRPTCGVQHVQCEND